MRSSRIVTGTALHKEARSKSWAAKCSHWLSIASSARTSRRDLAAPLGGKRTRRFALQRGALAAYLQETAAREITVVCWWLSALKPPGTSFLWFLNAGECALPTSEDIGFGAPSLIGVKSCSPGRWRPLVGPASRTAARHSLNLHGVIVIGRELTAWLKIAAKTC